MASRAVASKLQRPRSVTPATLLGWLQLAGSAVFLSFHAVRAWITVIVGRLFGKHPLSHPDWPLDLAVISAGFRVCMEKGCMVDFRPLLSGMSLLQFYPGLQLSKVHAGGCQAYWMRLHQSRPVADAQVVLFYVHGGAFVGGNARMTALTFQHWMRRLADKGIHAAVLSVEYPLAPEHHFPAAVVDTAAAYTWLCRQLQQHGSRACIIPVADSAGANILVAALAALRDVSSGSSMEHLVQAAAAHTATLAAAESATDAAEAAAEAAAEVEAAVTELFTSLTNRISHINSSSRTSAPPSNSSASSASSSIVTPDMTVQIGAGAASRDAAGRAAAAAASGTVLPAAAAAAAAFVPPAAVVLVSPAMDISERACFYDAEWKAQHESRFDYLPISVVGGGMHLYVSHTALLPCGYVSPLHMESLQGLVQGPWLVLSGAAELMGRDIDGFVRKLRSSGVPAGAVVHHVEPHMPHSWAILPAPSMWPRQKVILQFIAEQVAAQAKVL